MNPEQLKVIGRDFSMADWASEAKPLGFDGSVLVQTVPVRQETLDFLTLSQSTSSILGVVGWIDIDSTDAEAQINVLQAHPAYSNLVGFRYLAAYRSESDWAKNPSAQNFFRLCGKYALTVDLLLRSDQVAAAEEAVRSHPEVRFILDHLGNPNFDVTTPSAWSRKMQPLAALSNIALKLSGVASFATTPEIVEVQLPNYIQEALSLFGAQRIIFGSDWPVSRTRMRFSEMMRLVEQTTNQLSAIESNMIWAQSATDWYHLKGATT